MVSYLYCVLTGFVAKQLIHFSSNSVHADIETALCNPHNGARSNCLFFISFNWRDEPWWKKSLIRPSVGLSWPGRWRASIECCWYWRAHFTGTSSVVMTAWWISPSGECNQFKEYSSWSGPIYKEKLFHISSWPPLAMLLITEASKWSGFWPVNYVFRIYSIIQLVYLFIFFKDWQVFSTLKLCVFSERWRLTKQTPAYSSDCILNDRSISSIFRA